MADLKVEINADDFSCRGGNDEIPKLQIDAFHQHLMKAADSVIDYHLLQEWLDEAESQDE